MNVKLFVKYHHKGLLWRGYCVGIPIDADNRIVYDREFVARSFWAITHKGIKNKMQKNLMILKKEIYLLT